MIFCRLCLIWVICPLLQPNPGLAAAPQPGVIEGSLPYPSDFIPPDMTICAENLATKKLSCTHKHLKAKKYQYQVGYKLPVPPGDYHVYTYASRSGQERRQFPQGLPGLLLGFCQMRPASRLPVPCAVVVHVKRGESLKDIDPQDWYQ